MLQQIDFPPFYWGLERNYWGLRKNKRKKEIENQFAGVVFFNINPLYWEKIERGKDRPIRWNCFKQPYSSSDGQPLVKSKKDFIWMLAVSTTHVLYCDSSGICQRHVMCSIWHGRQTDQKIKDGVCSVTHTWHVGKRIHMFVRPSRNFRLANTNLASLFADFLNTKSWLLSCAHTEICSTSRTKKIMELT